jgi:hypothetical protein
VIFAAPSSIEYSVWLCRCTKEEFIGTPVYDRSPTDLGVSRCVSLPAVAYARNRLAPGSSGSPNPFTR